MTLQNPEELQRGTRQAIGEGRFQVPWASTAAVCLLPGLLWAAIIFLGFWQSHAPSQDEEAEVYRSLRYASGELRPIFAAWGPLPSYLLFVLYGFMYLLGRVAGVFSGTDDYLRLYLSDPRCFFLAGRILYALTGVLLLVAIGRFARRRFGTVAAIATVAALGFLPLTVTFATTVKSDGMAVLLGVLALSASLEPEEGKEDRTGPGRRPVAAGTLLGLAVGIKYHLALYVPGVVLGLWKGEPGRRSRRLGLAAACAAVALALSNPYALIHPTDWLFGEYGFHTMVTHQDPRKLASYGRADLWGYFAAGAGGQFPAILFSCVAVLSAWSTSHAMRCVAVNATVLTGVLVCEPYVEPHHLLPIFPLLALLTGAQVGRLTEILGRWRWAPSVAAALVAAVPLLRSLEAVQDASLSDTVAEAKRWVESDIPEGSRLLVDWAYAPTLHRSAEDLRAELEVSGPTSKPREELLRRMIRLNLRPAYRIAVLSARLRETQSPSEGAHFDLERYRSEGFQHAVISDAWYGRFFREPRLPEDEPIRAFYTALKNDCRALAKFEPVDGVRVGPSIWVVDIRR